MLAFTFNKDIICRESAYFKTALNGPFKEGVEQEVQLDDDPIVVAYFLRWLYTENLYIRKLLHASGVDMRCMLYGFAEKRIVPRLKVDILITYSGITPSHSWKGLGVESIKYVFNNTQDGSKLRQFALVNFLKYQTGNWSDFIIEHEMPASFSTDLIHIVQKHLTEGSHPPLKFHEPLVYVDLFESEDDETDK